MPIYWDEKPPTEQDWIDLQDRVEKAEAEVARFRGANFLHQMSRGESAEDLLAAARYDPQILATVFYRYCKDARALLRETEGGE